MASLTPKITAENKVLGGKSTVTPAKLSQTTGSVVDIAVSGGGKHISVLWGDLRKYQIFEVATWKSVEEGQGSGLCWAAQGETFATLDYVSGEKEVETLKRPKKDKKEVAAAPVARAVVRVCAVGTAERERREVHNCGAAVLLTGGLLLGIHTQPAQLASIPAVVPEPSTVVASVAAQTGPSATPSSPSTGPAISLPTPTFNAPPSPVSQPMPPQSSSASATPIATSVTTVSTTVQHTQVLQLYDWVTLRPHGPALPAPRLIVQDKEQSMYALAYDSWFIIVSINPTIRVINRIPHVITSGIWHNRTLIYTTPTEIRIIFPHEQEVFPLILCSFTFDPSTVVLGNREPTKDLMYRPHGFVTVAGVRENPPALLLVDSTTYKCFSVPLTYALTQFLMAVQANKIDVALTWTKKIEPHYHKQIARFLVARGFAKEAARLEGLNVATQFCVASRYNLTSTNETCFEGARAAFEGCDKGDEIEKREDEAGNEGEGEEGEGEKKEKVGSFLDLLAADACLALGRLATNRELMSIAFKTGSEISALACESLESSVPLHQGQEIQYLKQLWQQKMKLIDP